jgi:hypothetical protein
LSFREQVPLNLNIKYQRFNVSGRLFDKKPFSTHYISCCTNLRVGHEKIVPPPFGKKGKLVFVARLENLDEEGETKEKLEKGR